MDLTGRALDGRVGTIGGCFELAIDTILPAVLGLILFPLFVFFEISIWFLTRACLFRTTCFIIDENLLSTLCFTLLLLFSFSRSSLALAVVGLCLRSSRHVCVHDRLSLLKVLFVACPVGILLQLVIRALYFSCFSAFV